MRAARCLCLAAWLVACARAEDEIVGYEIDEDRLPELSDLLSELGIARVHDAFVDAGFDRTRMLLKMKDMDLKMLVREETLTEAEADALRGRLDVLRDVKKPVKRDVRDPLMERRAKLTYGRLYIERATAAPEFYTAWFGASMPAAAAARVRAAARRVRAAVAPDDDGEGGGGRRARRRRDRRRRARTCAFLDKAGNAGGGRGGARDRQHGQRATRPAAGYGQGGSNTAQIEGADEPESPDDPRSRWSSAPLRR